MAHPDEELVRQVNKHENQLRTLLGEASNAVQKARAEWQKLHEVLQAAKGKYPKKVERYEKAGIDVNIDDAVRSLEEAKEALRKERAEPFDE